MKTPEEWKREILAMPAGLPSILEIIESIQHDALSDPLTSTTDQQELDMANECAANEHIRADQLFDEMVRMRAKWHECRRYLRAANKGAERNAKALALAQDNYWKMVDSDKRWKERDAYKHEVIVWNWLLMTDGELENKLCTTFTQEKATAIRKLLKAMLGTKVLGHNQL